MKLNVKLTANELQDVVDAVADEAVDRGWDFTDDELFEDAMAMVDAALAAMGIEIVEEDDDYEDDDEDWDEDEDEDEEEEDEDDEESEPEGIHIPWHEAERLMNFAVAICCFCSGKKPGEVDGAFITEVNRFAREMFSKFCHSEGITHVDEEDE